MQQAVTQAADLVLGRYQTFRVSMHSAPGQAPYNNGQGLVELFEWVLTVPEAPFRSASGAQPERDMLRQLGGVYA
ncbi:hypothetical protein CSQ93_22870 [Janthinobacterium sp. BJB426]|nr:hypothetical protein CSQ93_22870 [Janthinobacterium sp. BJB426]